MLGSFGTPVVSADGHDPIGSGPSAPTIRPTISRPSGIYSTLACSYRMAQLPELAGTGLVSPSLGAPPSEGALAPEGTGSPASGRGHGRRARQSRSPPGRPARQGRDDHRRSRPRRVRRPSRSHRRRRRGDRQAQPGQGAGGGRDQPGRCRPGALRHQRCRRGAPLHRQAAGRARGPHRPVLLLPVPP